MNRLRLEVEAILLIHPAVREVAAELAARGLLRVTRGGAEVPAEAPGGPIRLGLPRQPDDPA